MLITNGSHLLLLEKYTMKVNGYRQLFGNQHSSNYKIDYPFKEK